MPREAVFTEGGDRVVYVAGPAGNARRVVKVGESDSRYTEITAGVAEGDRVLLTRP